MCIVCLRQLSCLLPNEHVPIFVPTLLPSICTHVPQQLLHNFHMLRLKLNFKLNKLQIENFQKKHC